MIGCDRGRTNSPPRLRVYAVVAALGLITFLVVYGPGHLLGTSAYWQLPQADERMALIGYRYFLHESWHWPIFLSHAVNVPYAKSVAFLDCIPLWALINKSIATLIPPWESFSSTAYLGLWHGLTYALQPVFGVACVRALGHTSWRTALVTAVFCIAVPTWIFRYAHPALSAHWLILWALSLYLRTPAGAPTPRRLGLARLAQLVVATLVTPYHAALSLSIYVPSVLRSRDRSSIAMWLPLGLACVALACWFAGYFAPEAARAQWGFDKESANLLGWLVPLRSGILGDARWLANPEATPWQYEGYAYLGLGVLVLLALYAPHVRSLRGAIARHRWLVAVVVISALFALSNHVYFGSHEIASYRIPSVLRWVRDQFRSPGRFVWVPTYALLIFLLHQAFTRFATPRRFAILALAATLQLVDATGDWRLQRLTTNGPQGQLLETAIWRPIVHAHGAVMILPPYGCVTGDDAEIHDHASLEIQLLASERGLPINGTYSARDMRHCAAEESEWPTLALVPGTLYVLLPQAFAVADRFAADGARCTTFAYGRYCARDAVR